MGAFIVYPALDIRGGRVVRLAQGDYARETQYGDDPLPRAQAFAATGARWMHLVDLDAAKAGGYTLLPLLSSIARETGLQVQTGGGVRSRDDVARILDAGASRVVVGSLSVREPDEPRFRARTQLAGCQLLLPDLEPMAVDVEVAHLSRHEPLAGATLRAGCRFLGLSAQAEKVILQYIFRVERQRNARERRAV